jgi:hypothetical protein
MNIKLPKAYSVYDLSYGNEIPVEQIFIETYNDLPSKYFTNDDYDMSVIEFIKQQGFDLICKVSVNNRRYDVSKQFLFFNEHRQIFIKLFEYQKDFGSKIELKIEFTYKISNGEIDDQFDLQSLKKHIKKKKKSNISLVRSDNGHLDVDEYELKIPKIDLKLNYGSEFLDIHNVILKRLNTNDDQGIILLHGSPGTGKTSYVKYLTSLVKEKEILFIPPSIAEVLSEPNIIPFLMEHKNSILVIEDAEKVISDREFNGSSAGVSNILNLTDGILGDCLNIQIIATFNMKKEKIDKALLRKGRLIAEHKFEELNINDTNNLLKHLKKDFISDKPMSLADIYNVDTVLYKVDDKTNKIGFIR